MAVYYWVGGSGNWSDSTNHWATTSGGAPNVANVPTSADDVHFNAASHNASCVITADVTANCKDLMFDAAPSGGTLTLIGSNQFNVYGNISLFAGMINGHGGAITMYKTSGTATITSNGCNLTRTLYIQAGGTVQLADNLTFLSGYSSTLSLVSGTFDANGKTVTIQADPASPRGVYGAFTLYNLVCVGGVGFGYGISLTANIIITGTLTLTGNSAINRLLVQSNTLGTARTITAANVSLTNCDFRDITGAGTAVWNGYTTGSELITTVADRDFSSDTGNWFFYTGVSITAGVMRHNNTSLNFINAYLIAGSPYADATLYKVTFTISNYSAGSVRAVVGNSSTGSSYVSGNGTYTEYITTGSLGVNTYVGFWSVIGTTLDIDNISVKQVTGLGSIGDCLGNSGITFNPSTTQIATGTASFSWSTHGWTSRVPLPQDDAVINNSFIAGRTITADMPRLGRHVTFSCTGSPTLSVTGSASDLYGSLIMATGMTTSGGSGQLNFSGRSPQTLRSNGVTFINGIVPNTYGSTLTLVDNLVTTSQYVYISSGTFNDGGFNVSTPTVTIINTSSLIKQGTWTITDTSWVASSNSTITDTAGSIKFTNNTSTAKVFNGGGKTYNKVWVTGIGSGALQITGSNTINTLKIDTLPKSIQFTAATTTTLGTIDAPIYNAEDNKFVRLNNTTTGYISSTGATSSTVGDLSVIWKCKFATLTPTSYMLLGGQAITAGQTSWYALISSAGYMAITYSVDGTAVVTKTSSVTLGSIGITVGTDVYLGIFHDVNNGAVGNDVKFYYSLDSGTTWVQLGATQTTAGIVSRKNSSDSINAFGLNTLGLSFYGDGYFQQVYSGQYSGFTTFGAGAGSAVLVREFNVNDWKTGDTWVSSTTGETYTRNGTALIYPEIKISSITNAQHTIAVKSGVTSISGNRLNISYSKVI
jgi:hypothetical protein